MRFTIALSILCACSGFTLPKVADPSKQCTGKHAVSPASAAVAPMAALFIAFSSPSEMLAAPSMTSTIAVIDIKEKAASVDVSAAASAFAKTLTDGAVAAKAFIESDEAKTAA